MFLFADDDETYQEQSLPGTAPAPGECCMISYTVILDLQCRQQTCSACLYLYILPCICTHEHVRDWVLLSHMYGLLYLACHLQPRNSRHLIKVGQMPTS